MSELSFKKDASFDKCPQCNAAGKLRRSRSKNASEKIVKKIGIFNYYRCRDCGWRGTRLNIGFGKTSLKTLFIYLLLMIGTAVVVQFVVQKIGLK